MKTRRPSSCWMVRMILGSAVLALKVSTRAASSLMLQRPQHLPVAVPPFPSPRRLYPQQWINKKICNFHHKSQIRMFSATFKYQNTQPQVTDGTLIARILPREYVEYERLKPSERRLPLVDVWRQRIVWPDIFWSEYRYQQKHRFDMEAPKINNEIVMLDVQIRTSIFDPQYEQFQCIKARMALQRESTESALRTLRRLELSSQRKLEHAKNRLNNRSPQRRISSNASNMDDSNTTILVLEPNSFGDCPEYEEDDMDGYRSLAIAENVVSMDLWLSLRNKSKTRLWMDILPEKEAGMTLDVESCPPTLLYVHTFEDFTSHVFVGVPLVIQTKTIHSDRTLVVWFANEKQVCFDSHFYTPTDHDIGKTITVLISPLRQDRPTGHEEVYEFQERVSQRPNLPILTLRSPWLARNIHPSRRSKELRVLSYNVMADIHLSPEVERRANYAGCQVDILARTRRMPLLLYEIIQHQADIICLQECDATVYEQLLRPALHAHGYTGFYSNKATSQLEGCAMFWSLDKFAKDAEMAMYPLRDLFHVAPELDLDWACTRDMYNFLEQTPDLQQVVQENVGQIVQVARLKLNHAVDQDQNPLSLVIGNTHLFYHPLADHVRLLQTFVICKMLDRWCTKDVSSSSFANSSNNNNNNKIRRHPLILCGDLNSDPASGAVQLLLHRTVSPNQCETWKNLDTYTWEGGDSYFESEYLSYENNPVQATDAGHDDKEDPMQTKPFDDPVAWSVQPPNIQLPETFPQLVSAYNPMPEFSNYVVGFTETLDYIFLSESDSQCPKLKVLKSAPVPTIAEMQKYPAIPNEDYPSDHVSLACDLELDYPGEHASK